jgi:hypothetical protein
LGWKTPLIPWRINRPDKGLIALHSLFTQQRSNPERKVAAMIRGVHTMFYSSQPEALRAFLRDKLDLPYTDVGEGWLIFDLPEAEMGCHPEDTEKGALSGKHDISFYCDDIEKTVAELKYRGVEFTDPVTDQGYGLVTHFAMPGDVTVQLYQPRYVKQKAGS